MLRKIVKLDLKHNAECQRRVCPTINATQPEASMSPAENPPQIRRYSAPTGEPSKRVGRFVVGGTSSLEGRRDRGTVKASASPRPSQSPAPSAASHGASPVPAPAPVAEVPPARPPPRSKDTDDVVAAAAPFVKSAPSSVAASQTPEPSTSATIAVPSALPEELSDFHVALASIGITSTRLLHRTLGPDKGAGALTRYLKLLKANELYAEGIQAHFSSGPDL